MISIITKYHLCSNEIAYSWLNFTKLVENCDENKTDYKSNSGETINAEF